MHSDERTRSERLPKYLMKGYFIKEGVKQLLYPARCPVCEKVLSGQFEIIKKKRHITEDISGYFICNECMAGLDLMNVPRCMKCSRPVNGEREYCDMCSGRPPEYDAGVALLAHDENARKIIYDLKYSSIKDNAVFLGYMIAVRFGKLIESWDADVIIPVPLHRSRLRERGFNQAELLGAEVIFFMKALGYKAPKLCTDVLVRSRKTSPLKGMKPLERAGSMKGAIVLNDAYAKNGLLFEKAIVIDDIYTTGTTIGECTKQLRSAGARMVYYISASIGEWNM